MKAEGTEFRFRVETTKPSTAEQQQGKEWPVTLRASQSVEVDQTWLFTDGSGTGWHAAVIVRPGNHEHHVTGCNPTSSSNVGAELDGVILGLEHARRGEVVAIVSDYLWTAYYINGWWQVRDPYLCERVAQARKVHQRRRLANALFVHHPGHQRDSSDFSRWNNVADRLCGEQSLVNRRLSLRQQAEAEEEKRMAKRRG